MATKVASDAEPSDATPAKRFETLRAIFWAALIALGIRSFLVEPFKIPSGSMIPTLLVGDYVLVNRFAYGLRLPITGTLLVPIGAPARGDIAVFRFPDNERIDFIKRVVGMPGDKVQISGGRLFVNDQLLDWETLGPYTYPSGDRSTGEVTERFRERNPEGVEYAVLHSAATLPHVTDAGPFIVPEGHYFMMGDNRDNSSDSRRWTNHYVSPEHIKGRAFLVHWSWLVAPGQQPDRGFLADLGFTLWRVVTFQIEEVRWNRIGRSLSRIAD